MQIQEKEQWWWSRRPHWSTRCHPTVTRTSRDRTADAVSHAAASTRSPGRCAALTSHLVWPDRSV